MKVTTKPPEPVKPDIVIELTWDEVEALRNVLLLGASIAAHSSARSLAIDLRERIDKAIK